MRKFILSILTILFLQASIFSQEDTTFQTTFELQGGIGFVNLLGAKGGKLPKNELTSYQRRISDINHTAGMVWFGAIFSRQIKQRFWLRSGLLINYLRAEASYDLIDSYESGFVLTEDAEVSIASFGVQMPIAFEYRSEFENFGFYANAGTIWSYSYPDVKRRVFVNNDNHVNQHGLAASLGFGVILNQRNWHSWRIGYKLSSDIIPFHRGNNTRDKIYHPVIEADRDYRHLIHQLEFAYVWPTQEVVLDQSIKNLRWTGWFLGTSLSVQAPPKNTELDGRKGIGWGRNVYLKWVARKGFGLRLQYGKWIAPESNNRTTILMNKVEFLYQLPYALELTTGISFRNESDTKDRIIGESYKGLLMGAGSMIPLRHNFGLQLDLTAHYTPKYSNEKFLMEIGIGLIYNVF